MAAPITTVPASLHPDLRVRVADCAPAQGVAGAGHSLLRERVCARTLRWIAAAVALGLAGHLVVLLWAQHDFTPVEALVALHSNMFAEGEGLYWGVNRHPYTISPYGPIFYAVSGWLQHCGVPAYQSGRVLSFAALLASLYFCWRILGHLTGNRFARISGVILAASTANVLFWGTVGQTDLLACCFSLAAFDAYLRSRGGGEAKHLVLSGFLVVLAVFTKQTFLAAGGAVAIGLLWEDRKRAAWWIPAMTAVGAGIAFALNAVTHGGYFEDAVWANINPFAWYKLTQHIQYLILSGAGVIVTALAGAWRMSRRTAPLYIYAGLATGIWLATAPKIGSDLNYQVEMSVALAMCAAVGLDRLEFFSVLFSARRQWITLLQIPLLLHVGLNLLLTARVVAERALMEPYKRAETETLRPFVERPGRLFSTHYDSLVRYRGRIEVEPLIYGLLVRAGVTDPAPVTRDFTTRQFATVILAENVFAPGQGDEDAEMAHLPDPLIEAIRNNYKVVRQVDGPNTVYIYEPRN